MDPLELALAGVCTLGTTAFVALTLARAPRLATLVAAAGAVAGGILTLAAAIAGLANGWTGELTMAWQVPGGSLVVGIDPLTSFFLAPLGALGALAAIYGRSYLGARVTPAALLNLFLAAMAVVLIARQGLVFLVAWEAMTLLAYLLVTTDHGDADVRRAGWVYLIASHIAMVALIALFLALGGRAAGVLGFDAIAAAWREPSSGVTGILILALGAFGIKAGVFGLHAWLPEAHAAAPSHVSALMSGVLIKLGVYGVLRTTLLVPPPAWFGVVVMIAGAAGAVFGIALALQQRDLKRVLAYSSVENVGIIFIGLGLGFWARAHGEALLATLAFGGGLLHLWNHAAMKGLLFLSAGSILHGAGTKDLEQLGGLLGRMRWTGRAMIIGAVAIAALPPLCGFTSEWLIYRALAQVGLHGAAVPGLAAIAGIAVIALVGGLAALCFVRLVGVVLLGQPRGEGATSAHESPPAMIVPLGVLAAVCLVAAFAAPALVSAFAPVLAELALPSGAEVAAVTGFLWPVVLVNAALLAAGGLAASAIAWRVRRAVASETWGCGYAAPSAHMQYTGHAFAELLTARVLPRWLRSCARVRPPEGMFPTAAAFATEDVDPLTRAAYEPFLARWGDRFARLRFLQQGNVHIYLLYILAAAIGALGWVAARDWWSP